MNCKAHSRCSVDADRAVVRLAVTVAHMPILAVEWVEDGKAVGVAEVVANNVDQVEVVGHVADQLLRLRVLLVHVGPNVANFESFILYNGEASVSLVFDHLW